MVFCIILVSKILNLIFVKNYENFLVSKVLNVIFVFKVVFIRNWLEDVLLYLLFFIILYFLCIIR